MYIPRIHDSSSERREERKGVQNVGYTVKQKPHESPAGEGGFGDERVQMRCHGPDTKSQWEESHQWEELSSGGH